MMRRNLGIIIVGFVSIVFASGCYVEVDDRFPGAVDVDVDVDVAPLMTDLEVGWTIDHSDAAFLCSLYGIDRWKVTIYGPESRENVLSCRDNWWSSEADFHSLLVGDYRVTVTAVDDFDMIIGSVSTTILAFDHSEQLTINFSGASL